MFADKLIYILSVMIILMGFVFGAQTVNPYAIIPALMLISIGVMTIAAVWLESKQ